MKVIKIFKHLDFFQWGGCYYTFGLKILWSEKRVYMTQKFDMSWYLLYNIVCCHILQCSICTFKKCFYRCWNRILFFWPCCMACGSLVPQSGIKLGPQQWKCWVLTTGPPVDSVQFRSVQSFSHVRLFATPWTTAQQASLSITNSWTLPKLMSTESVMPSNHLILCNPLLLLTSIFPSIRIFPSIFKWVSSSHQVAKVLEFQLQHQPFQWIPRTDLL